MVNTHTNTSWRICAVVITLSLLLALPQASQAQTGPTATPIPIILASPTPQIAAPAAGATATWTATPAGLAVLEPLDVANVRAEPDINGAQLGIIRAGEVYTITGRYFEWYQIQFSGSPNGRAWVFGQIVNITGDPASIPEVTLEPLPTTDPLILGATQTQEVLTLTPGGVFTATVSARGVIATLEIPGAQIAPLQQDGTPASSGPALPTFTYPPGMIGMAPTSGPPASATPQTLASSLEITSESLRQIPPIMPILALGGLGTLGLVLSLMRRGK